MVLLHLIHTITKYVTRPGGMRGAIKSGHPQVPCQDTQDRDLKLELKLKILSFQLTI